MGSGTGSRRTLGSRVGTGYGAWDAKWEGCRVEGEERDLGSGMRRRIWEAGGLQGLGWGAEWRVLGWRAVCGVWDGGLNVLGWGTGSGVWDEDKDLG